MQIKSNRIEWADNLKALAILLVVLGHTGLEGQSIFVAKVSNWIYEFHMPLFFLLSGISFYFVFDRGYRSLAKQTANIVLIYVIQSVLYILLNICVQKFLHLQTNAEADMGSFRTLFFIPVAHFWYLYALFIIYIAETLLNRFVKDDRARLVIVIACSCFGMLTSFGILSRALYELMYFEFGRRILYAKKPPMWLCAVGIVGSFVMLFVTIDNVYISDVITVLIALSVSFFLAALFSKYFDRNYGLITSVGKNCIWIYVFHTYFTSVSRNICNKIIPSVPELSMLIGAAAGITGSMIIMFVFGKLRINRIVTKPISYLVK